MEYDEENSKRLLELLKSSIRYDYGNYDIDMLKYISIKDVDNIYELYYLILTNLNGLKFITFFKDGDIRDKTYDYVHDHIDIFIRDNTYFIYEVENIHGLMTTDFINFYECDSDNNTVRKIIHAPKFKKLELSSVSLASAILDLITANVLTELLFSEGGTILNEVSIYKSLNSNSTYAILIDFDYYSGYKSYLFTLSL